MCFWDKKRSTINMPRPLQLVMKPLLKLLGWQRRQIKNAFNESFPRKIKARVCILGTPQAPLPG